MNANDYWQIFIETGAPEMYLLYNKAKNMENSHVLDNTGISAEGYKLQ